MVEAPGENPAKLAMDKFIKDNTVIFDAFKWSACKYLCLSDAMVLYL